MKALACGVGLHVQLRRGIQVQDPRAFPHGLVKFGKLRFRRLDARAEQVEPNSLLDQRQGPSYCALPNATEGRGSDKGRQVLVERMAEVRGINASESYSGRVLR